MMPFDLSKWDAETREKVATVIYSCPDLDNATKPSYTAIRSIPVNRILYFTGNFRPPVNEAKLAQFTMLAVGPPIPHIYVWANIWGKETIYTINDGHYRAAAAARAGLTRVPAVIAGEMQTRPDIYMINRYETGRGGLWCRTAQGGYKLDKELDAEYIDTLLAAGVPNRPYWQGAVTA